MAGILPFGGHLLIQCQVFFDESASHDGAPFLCLAGLIFEKEQAIKLSRQWRKILEWRRLPYFHMVDCAHGNWPFDHLTKDERIDVARRMIEIIKRRAVQGLAVTIDNADFASVMAEFPVAARHYKTAYAFCSHTILSGVQSWIFKNQKVQEMAYFFEDGHGSKSQTDAIMGNLFANPEKRQQYRYAGRGFVPKEKSCAVQAADLLAWQWYTDRRHQIEGKPRRKDCESLFQLHWNAVHLDRAAITKIITMSPIMARQIIHGPIGRAAVQKFASLR